MDLKSKHISIKWVEFDVAGGSPFSDALRDAARFCLDEWLHVRFTHNGRSVELDPLYIMRNILRLVADQPDPEKHRVSAGDYCDSPHQQVRVVGPDPNTTGGMVCRKLGSWEYVLINVSDLHQIPNPDQKEHP